MAAEAACSYHIAARRANLDAFAPSLPPLGLRPSQSKVFFISGGGGRWWMRRTKRLEGKASGSISSSRARARPMVKPALFSPAAMEWQECRGAVRFFPKSSSSCRVQLTVACEVPEILAPVAQVAYAHITLKPFLEGLLLEGLERFATFAKERYSKIPQR